MDAFIAAFRPQDDTEAEYWIGGRQRTIGTAYWGINCAGQNETPWGCWEWDDYDPPSLPAMWQIWMPSDHCGTWPDWCQGWPPPDLDCVTGGWLPGEPDDGGSLNCVDTRQEDAMVLVLNHDDDPLEHGFADVDSNGVQPRKALIMRRAGTRTTQEYERLWAYEFRYDGGRERYLVRKLDRFTLEPDGDLWTDYDVDGSVYGDYTLDGGTPTEQTRYVPGLGQQAVGSAVDYLFGDQIGTLRMTRSATTPPVTTKRVYTAFGELVEYTGGTTRYGYAGAWGYQEHDADGAGGPDNTLGSPPTGPAIGEVFPFLHVGWRYYDPSTGRFLQRDPIGIEGGLNVYAYVFNLPVIGVDPEGEGFWDGNNPFHDWVARNFWLRFHSPEWINSPYATAEAIGISVVGGLTAGRAIGPCVTRLVPKAYNPWIGTGGLHPPHHGMGRHLEIIIRWFQGRNIKGIFPGKSGWPWIGIR